MAEFPNGLLLTTPLENDSPTAAYLLHHICMPMPEALAGDLDRIKAAGLKGCRAGGVARAVS